MNSRTLIIAEAGVNHNGDINKAKKLIDVAAEAGADYVKFQSFKANKLVSPSAKKAEYQITNVKDSDQNQYQMLKNLELSDIDHNVLIKYCQNRNIKFLSTAFDVEGLEYLNSLGFDVFKSPSGEITNYPYLKKLSELGKPVILSTGMASLEEIERALEVLTSNTLTLDDITVLHCNTEYPTPYGDVNLKAMETLAEECDVKVGYSDHTLGIEVPIAAVALGAKVIEKHFTLDRTMEGPDHAASLEPNELAAMVSAIRNIELSIAGNGEKLPSNSEKKNITIARKSIHLQKSISKGETLKESDLIPLRPGDGISPMEWDQIVGRKANRNLPRFHKLDLKDLE